MIVFQNLVVFELQTLNGFLFDKQFSEVKNSLKTFQPVGNFLVESMSKRISRILQIALSLSLFALCSNSPTSKQNLLSIAAGSFDARQSLCSNLCQRERELESFCSR